MRVQEWSESFSNLLVLRKHALFSLMKSMQLVESEMVKATVKSKEQCLRLSTNLMVLTHEEISKFSWQQTGLILWIPLFQDPVVSIERSSSVFQSSRAESKSLRSMRRRWPSTKTFVSSLSPDFAQIQQVLISAVSALKQVCLPFAHAERVFPKKT